MTSPDSERVLTPALLAFLLAVAGVVGWAVATRHPSPDLEGCIEWLADGDLDRDERGRMLLRTMELASDDGTARGRVAGYLAAVAVEDEQEVGAFAGVFSGLELAEGERRWLDLGDPLLANLLSAHLQESAGDVAAARTTWSQVAAQARMVGNELAAKRAADALERLR